MKHLYLTSLVLLLFVFSANAQKNNKSNGNKETGRTNLILPHGNVGLNTLTPSERLEVIGNVRVSQTVFANDIDVVGLKATNVTVRQDIHVGRNAIIDGNVGIGVTNPTERLEIMGNLKVSDGIFSNTIETNTFTGENGTFTQDLIVERNFNVNGVTGLGVTNPTERLEVAGNLKVTDGIYSNSMETQTFTGDNGTFNQNLNISQILTVDGNTGLGIASPTERLDVSGNIQATGNLLSDGLTIQQGNVANNFTIGQTLNVNGNTGLGVVSPSERLEVDGNVKVSNSLFADLIESNSFTVENSTINNELTVGGNALIGGNIGLGVTAPTERLDIDGNIKTTGNLFATDIEASNGLFGGDLTTQKNLKVNSTSTFNGKVTTNAMTVKGLFEVKNNANIVGSLGIGIGAPEAALHVAGDGKFDGNLTAVKLIVEELEVANMDFGNGSSGGDMSFNENLYVDGSVGIGTQKIDGYKLSVNGKIRASDDIKVYPASQWADYVFENEYDLMPLDQVEDYIKSNKHLPEMPTTEQVKESGIELGAMDANLLKKVEELTLYMIELKKENKELRKEVETLKQSINN